jgi:cell division septal protein FtsQ
MVRRPALGLPRVPSFAVPRLAVPSARTLALAGGVVTLLLLAYLAARETAVFAVHTVEVSGAPSAVETDVRRALRDVDGRSLVVLDPGDVEARLEKIPYVRFAYVDRSFPHDLLVRIVAERPLALLRSGDKGWIVSAGGRVLGAVEPRAHQELPRIRVPLEVELEPGATLREAETSLALRLLAALPPRFPARPLAAESSGGEVSLVVEGWIKLRLGTPDRLEEKLAAAAAVLRSMTPEERVALSYLDASVPERVVGAAKSQLESES